MVRVESGFCGYCCLDSVRVEKRDKSVCTTTMIHPQRVAHAALSTSRVQSQEEAVSSHPAKGCHTPLHVLHVCTGPGLAWDRHS